MFYWLMKHVFLGPLLRLVYRPKARGLENIPASGPVILAANHVSFLDSLFVPLMVKRPVVFLGKADYFASAKTRWSSKMKRRMTEQEAPADRRQPDAARHGVDADTHVVVHTGDGPPSSAH